MSDHRYQILGLVKWVKKTVNLYVPEHDLILIGENNELNEDQPEGELLTAMLKAIQLTRQDVCIANTQTFNPQIKTKLIVTMGEMASHHLLNTKSSLESLRNTIHRYGDTSLIVTYHPAHLISNPAEKKKAYSDLLLIQRTLKGMQDASFSHTTEQVLPNSTS